MSTGSNTSQSQKINLEPLRNIGAQDILKVEYSYYGHLRKKGKFEGMMAAMRNNWKQKFVVISQGCVYCFKNEFAEKPVSAFSLSVYDSIKEVDNPKPHCFEIKHEIVTKPSQVFQCESQERRSTWIAYLNDAIQMCHQHSGGSTKLSGDSDEGISMQARRAPRKSVSLGPAPAIPGGEKKEKKYKESKSEYDLESSEDEGPAHTEDVYDDIAEEGASKSPTARALPKPPTQVKIPAGAVSIFPGGASMPGNQSRPGSISKRPAVALPTVKKKVECTYSSSPDEENLPDYLNELFLRETYIFDSEDKAAAKGYLQNKPDGTFLVRKSKSSGGQVLSIQTLSGVKEFQITEENGHMHLIKANTFPSLDAMLTYYHANAIPKGEYTVKLTKGYKS